MARAAQKSPELNIDLLPKDNLAGQGGAVHWVLTVGRYLIIVTEIIALATFVLGILLSKEKNDLKASIKSKSEQVAGQQNCNPSDETVFCEKNFRKVQTQLNQISLIRASHFPTNAVINEFLRLLPQGVELSDFSLDGSEVHFSGTFLTEKELQTLINSFNRSTKIVNLDIIELVKEDDFKFTATADIDKATILKDIPEATLSQTNQSNAEQP